MHVNMLAQLKLYQIEFLKVELIHPENAIGGQITPPCTCFNGTLTGLSSLLMINSRCDCL